LIGIAMVYDRITREQVHPIYWIAARPIDACQPAIVISDLSFSRLDTNRPLSDFVRRTLSERSRNMHNREGLPRRASTDIRLLT